MDRLKRFVGIYDPDMVKWDIIPKLWMIDEQMFLYPKTNVESEARACRTPNKGWRKCRVGRIEADSTSGNLFLNISKSFLYHMLPTVYTEILNEFRIPKVFFLIHRRLIMRDFDRE